ncbi:DNA polymerase-3 subunit alpha [Thermosyntropha lipolytica DSM 11003]|uniref:DNA polymerase III PolC-type n=1 Tax=Thermosyntropha lipolytica DSM 11003 TaxID=1123382 RepID=A0A1M5KVT6_9FIRM|nr:PolC-type DNA polymerase III [Thermosyntropha lipolytica]SHG56972.1 DNA polymerase-3 subunit alpha [Thermosyntropha lipolytica DSM 11003]
MNRRFDQFLADNLDRRYAKLWEGAVISRLEVCHKNRLWRLHVNINKPLTAEIINETASQLNRKVFPFLDNIQIIPYLNYFEKNVKNILAFRARELEQDFFAGTDFYNRISWQVEEGRIDLVVEEEKVYDYIIKNQVLNRLSAWFWHHYLLRLLVRVIFTHNSKNISSLPDKVFTAGEVEILDFNPSPALKEAAFTNKEKPRGRRLKKKNNLLETDNVIKVCELEEGLKRAVVQGEIWNKEVTSLRDGRYVVTYWLTDHTDTILIKYFVDDLEEDEINTGDWIKACGGVRYDNFARELVLFLEGYQKIEPQRRRDCCQEKRIELHAHTKMSAMDGLVEASELVARAASWGHAAIAITDHGCVQAYPEAWHAAEKHKIKLIYGVEGYLVENDKKEKPYHIVLLACNRTGIKNIYKLVSKSYLENFYRKPKILRADLIAHREGILVGTACEAGELFTAVRNGASEDKILEIASFYDYFEIQPLKNNEFMIKNGWVENEERIKEINRFIYELGKRLGKPVVATGDVHFLDPEDEVFRRIIQAGQGYADAEAQAPLYFKTTEEMLEEFSYLGEEEAKEVVIYNTHKVAGMVEDVKPVLDGFYPPKIEGAEQEIINLTWNVARDKYGENMPPMVEERIKRELDAIINNGFSVLYLIAHKLVKKSNEDGYLVGSRGSVGSSLVAYFCGITEVNPLPPHYLCPQCKYSEFIADGSVGCGADLEDKLCPRCGEELSKNGFDIPFETFLGFEGDKVPDIDLNFSGDYQSRAHQYVEEIFGKENVFRAGTISTIAEKTAYGFVKKYAEDNDIFLKNSEILRLARGITGVKRTTGQHPGGMIVVPHDKSIFEFTPIQYPADNQEAGVITTHFDYHAIDAQLVKLDILGHDDPTVIRELEELTGVNARSISLSEKETMRIFSSVEPLGIKPEDIGSKVGTFGIPEFGTRFVRQMLEETRPTSFSELVRISGLSHGTDVWLNNAQDLIQKGIATLSEVICTRDDIMVFLIYKGLDKKRAFKIMEQVRKGKGLNPEDEELMRQHGVPEWYIESCKKIKYMFPKAHAVAYVTMAFRIAYFKVYYPKEFYASFFSIRAEDFEADTILKGYDAVRRRIEEIERMGNAASQKDKKLLPVLELAMEAYARGIKFYPVDIYVSDASKFKVYKDGLILPFSALPNVGEAAAQGVLEARKEGKFISIEDFQLRTKLNKTAMEILKQHGCFKGMPESSQMTLFA